MEGQPHAQVAKARQIWGKSAVQLALDDRNEKTQRAESGFICCMGAVVPGNVPELVFLAAPLPSTACC